MHEDPTRVPPPHGTIREFGIASATNRPVLLVRETSLMCRSIKNSTLVFTVGTTGQMQISWRWQQRGQRLMLFRDLSALILATFYLYAQSFSSE
jgi:hypothetical protein